MLPQSYYDAISARRRAEAGLGEIATVELDGGQFSLAVDVVERNGQSVFVEMAKAPEPAPLNHVPERTAAELREQLEKQPTRSKPARHTYTVTGPNYEHPCPSEGAAVALALDKSDRERTTFAVRELGTVIAVAEEFGKGSAIRYTRKEA